MHRLLHIALLVVGALYPLLVFTGLRHFSVRELSVAVLALVAVRVLFAARALGRHLGSVLAMGGCIGVPVAAALLSGEEIALRLVPAAINAALLVLFSLTLRATPMIERFARLYDPDLGPEQQRHCRQFTHLWCLYFGANAAASLALAFGPRSWWTIHTGILSYLVMGALFAAEFLMRRYRFRQFSGLFYDRLLARLMSGGAP